MKKKPGMKPFFSASVNNSGALEMMVYEDIGAGFFTDGVTATAVKQQMDKAANFSSITVRINSPGGDAFEGIAIHNLLKSQVKPVHVVVDGLAASAASVIAMAGDSITMAPNAMMMIHNGSMFCNGDASDMRKAAEILDKVSASIGQTYVSRTGKSADEVKSMMDAETWMSAQDCMDNGFATAISSDEDAEAMNMARSFKSLSQMKKVPEVLKADSDDDGTGGECQCDCLSCMAGDCHGCTHEDCDPEDENCAGCPMGDPMPGNKAAKEVAEESNLSLYEARLKMLSHLQV